MKLTRQRQLSSGPNTEGAIPAKKQFRGGSSMKKTSIFLAVLIIFMSLATPAYAWNDWDIPGTYDVTSEKPATFVIAFVERDYQTGNNMTVTMIGESSERVLGFKYDNKTGEARMGGNIGDEYFDDLMYIKFDFGSSAWALRGEGYMRWGEKGAEKIPFTMVKTDGESEIRHPSAGDIEVPRDKNGKPIDSGIRFSDLSGEVQVRPGDDRLAWDFAELDMVLYHGDVIRVKRDSQMIISLPDMTTFVLRGPAEIVLNLYDEEESKLLLLAGKVITNLKKMYRNESIVEMGQAIAGARGTTYVMEEDGMTSTLKVLEGIVSFKPNNGEELLITDGQMVSATDGVAGEITGFSIEEELSDWDQPTQAMFREILAEAGREKKAASRDEISSTENTGEEADYTELFEKEIAKYESHVKMKSFLIYGLGIAFIGLIAAAVIFIRKRKK